MKTKTSRQLAAVTLALLAAAQLAGCGGSGSSSTTSPAATGGTGDTGSIGGTGDTGGTTGDTVTVTVSGKAADGYLAGAKVCLDTGSNMKCDAGEPTAITGAGGAFSLEVPSGIVASAHSIVVEVSETTVDEDTGAAVGKPFVLSAPAGESDFISPMTTVVHGMLQQNPSLTLDDVVTQVKLSIGTSADVSLFEDYVAAKKDTSNVAAAADYERIHLIAQVAAKVMAANQEAVLAAANSQNVGTTESNAALLALVTNATLNSLESAAQAVDEAHEAGVQFNVAAVPVVLANVENLAQQVEETKAAASAAKSSMESVLAEGLYWIWAEAGEEDDEIEYGRYQTAADNAGRLTEIGFDYVDGSWVSDALDETTSFLTATGWKDVVDSGSHYAVSFDADEAAILSLDDTSYTMKASAAEVDVSGKPIKDSLGYYGHELALDSIVGDPVFSSGAKVYQFNMISTVDNYTIDSFDCDEGHVGDSNGDCNVVYGFRSGGQPANGQPAKGLADLLYGKDQPKTGPWVSVGEGIQLRLVQGEQGASSGSIHITDEKAGNQVSEGLWAIKTVTLEDDSKINLVMLTLPERFTPRFYDAGKPFLALKDGYTRRGVLLPAGSAEMLGEPQFNSTAFKNIQDASDLF